MGRITLRRDGAVAVIELDNPGKRNAVDAAMRDGLNGAYAEVRGDHSVRVVVITGAEPEGFCAGGAIDGYLAGGAFGPSGTGPPPLPKPWPMSPPVIAAVNGHAVGGGFALALACDLRVVGRGSTLGASGLMRGAAQGAQQSQRLGRLIGASKALELLLLSRWIGGEEAAAIGLANVVVDDGLVLERALAMAHEIAKFSPSAVALTKRLVYEGHHLPLDEAFAWEQELMLDSYRSPDALEGFRAFNEGREPRWAE
jgi:enoyl-CoA hydratase/carnithine racemase